MNNKNEFSKEYYMQKALDCAKESMEHQDVPVGCVIVRHGEIIAASHNCREKNRDATCHAETEAIRAACKALGGWHLTDCEMYVTLEPCTMCAGAIINSRIDKVYVGAKEPHSGAFGGAVNVLDYPVNHKPEICFGVMEEECARLIKEFFGELRQRGKRR